ncbi:DUF3180 domain-containing protein [Arcanobacterium pinnipediorum]|uniref:DUF3180 family protein n=1 Tax=Arcanobacterium pinnipediorum TaxID=1503041 RepID=A0ABY5AK97_9ACTO|nr:DUF3180 domain-containing protein [Arcanobacterium pinnipediorum]USR80201.1 DUF3180 family protein [Arcanobacterium pinnipediorum]
METNEHYTLRPTTWLTLLSLFLVSGVTTFFVIDTWLSYGRAPILFPVVICFLPLIVAMLIVWQGWRVRAYSRGDRPLSMLSAARIWILSQAVSRTGTITAGICAGMTVSYLGYSYSDLMVDQAIIVGIAGLASLIMAGAGMLAESWCKTDDDDSLPPGATA